jgi:hypothetical protein
LWSLAVVRRVLEALIGPVGLDAETGHVMLVQASGVLSAFLGLLWLVTLF